MTTGDESSTMRTRVTAADIPRFFPPCNPYANKWKVMKNQRYPINMSALPMGMKCTFNILSCLTKMKYKYHDLLEDTDCTIDPFEVNT